MRETKRRIERERERESQKEHKSKIKRTKGREVNEVELVSPALVKAMKCLQS